MSIKDLKPEDTYQMDTRSLRQMAKYGIGHSCLMDIADNLSNKKKSKRSTRKTKVSKSKKKKTKTKKRTKKQLIADAKKGKYVNPLTNRKCSYKYALKKGFITELGEKIPLKDMKFENPDTGREVSYSYAKRKGII